FQRDRGGYRGSEALAKPAAGRALSHRVSGCADGEGARRRSRAEQSHLRGAGREPRGTKGSTGAVGSADGRGEVLAAGADGGEEGVTESRGQRYFHRLR